MSDNTAITFKDGQDLTAAVLNAMTTVFDTRLRSLEGQSASYTAAIETLNQFGLDRLNTALLPVYQNLTKIAQLGAIFSATSVSSANVGIGQASFIIDAGVRDQFAPALYLGIQAVSDLNTVMTGSLVSYDRTTGTLVVGVQQFTGASGTTISGWRISAAGTPNLGASANSIGAYSQGQVDSLISNLSNSLLGGVSAGGNTMAKLFALINTASSSLSYITFNSDPTLDSFYKVLLRFNQSDTTVTSLSSSVSNLTSNVGLLSAAALRSDISQAFSSAAKAQLASNMGVASVPTGAVIHYLGTDTPAGFLPLNGTTYSRTTYSNLWAWAGTNSTVQTEAAWNSNNWGSFSQGDGSTTFRLPDWRGEFVRGLDESRGVDSNRSLGSAQSHMFQDHTHMLNAPGVGGLGASGTGYTYATGGTAAGGLNQYGTLGAATGTPGAETRPRNVTARYFIKY